MSNTLVEPALLPELIVDTPTGCAVELPGALGDTLHYIDVHDMVGGLTVSDSDLYYPGMKVGVAVRELGSARDLPEQRSWDVVTTTNEATLHSLVARQGRHGANNFRIFTYPDYERSASLADPIDEEVTRTTAALVAIAAGMQYEKPRPSVGKRLEACLGGVIAKKMITHIN